MARRAWWLELGVRVTDGGDITGVSDGGGITRFDPQAAAISMTAGTKSASLQRNRVGPGVETTTT
jgi:hypothetical protein